MRPLNGRFRRSIVITLVLGTAIAAASAACASGGDDDASAPTEIASSTTRTPSAAGTAATTASVGDATADPNASPERGTPGAQTPSNAGNTPITGGGGEASTPSPGGAPASGFEATIAAEAGGDIAGGDPSQPQLPVGDVPTPPPGANIDDDEIAPPNPSQAGLQAIVDMDAGTAGIQATRTVNVGDVIKVAIVGANLPSNGISAFNFNLDYDKTKVVAPSYTGGSSTDRNPDLNNAALGDGWTCLPAPEGDLDDEGGINGDGNAGTGRALLSCFNLTPAGAGTIVLATIEFRVVAAGTASLDLNGLAITEGGAFVTFARCQGDPEDIGGQAIPCVSGSVTAQ